MAWQIDKSHSQIHFSVKHMMIAKVRGTFEEWDVEIDFDEDNPAATTLTAVIDTDSINTRDEKRDEHLRSPDFLNADEYPEMVFTSTRIEQTGPNRGRLIGDLTIRDVTHEVALDVAHAGVLKAPWGAETAGFSGKTTISRKDWGLEWNVALEAGGWLVGDTIDIEIELELVKVQEQVAEAVA